MSKSQSGNNEWLKLCSATRRSVPVTLTLDTIRQVKEGDYLVTPKLDGERVLVVANECRIVVLNSKGEKRELLSSPVLSDHPCVPFVLDCEMVGRQIYAFDVLASRFGAVNDVLLGRDCPPVTGIPRLSSRIAEMDRIFRSMNSIFSTMGLAAFPLFKKAYHTKSRGFLAYWRKMNYEVATDGLIFEPEAPDLPSYKWKPHDRHTVDLYTRFVGWADSGTRDGTGSKSAAILAACPSCDRSPAPAEEHSLQLRVPLTRLQASQIVSSSRSVVVSFAMRPEGVPWEIECVRLDKSRANTVGTYLSCRQAYQQFVDADTLFHYLCSDMIYDDFVAMVRSEGVVLLSDHPSALRPPPLHSKSVHSTLVTFPETGGMFTSETPLFVPHFTPSSPEPPSSAIHDGNSKLSFSVENKNEMGGICPQVELNRVNMSFADLQVLVIAGRGALYITPGSQNQFHPMSIGSSRAYAKLDRCDPIGRISDRIKGHMVWTSKDGVIDAVHDPSARMVMARYKVDMDAFASACYPREGSPSIRDMLSSYSTLSIQSGEASYYERCAEVHGLVPGSEGFQAPGNVSVYLVSRSATKCVRFEHGASGSVLAYDVIPKFGRSGPKVGHFEDVARMWNRRVEAILGSRRSGVVSAGPVGRGKAAPRRSRPSSSSSAAAAAAAGLLAKKISEGIQKGLSPVRYEGCHAEYTLDHLNWFGYAPLNNLFSGKQDVVEVFKEFCAQCSRLSKRCKGYSSPPIDSGILLDTISSLHVSVVGGVVHELYSLERKRVSENSQACNGYIARSIARPYDLGVLRGSVNGPFYASGIMPFPAGAFVANLKSGSGTGAPPERPVPGVQQRFRDALEDLSVVGGSDPAGGPDQGAGYSDAERARLAKARESAAKCLEMSLRAEFEMHMSALENRAGELGDDGPGGVPELTKKVSRLLRRISGNEDVISQIVDRIKVLGEMDEGDFEREDEEDEANMSGGGRYLESVQEGEETDDETDGSYLEPSRGKGGSGGDEEDGEVSAAKRQRTYGKDRSSTAIDASSGLDAPVTSAEVREVAEGLLFAFGMDESAAIAYLKASRSA